MFSLKEIQIILIIAIIVTIAVFGFYYYKSLYFYANSVISIVKISELNLEQSKINYDGYYLIETQRIFGRRLGEFLTNKYFLASNLGNLNQSLKITAKKINDYDYSLILKSQDKEKIYQYLEKLKIILKNEIEKSSKSSGEAILFSIEISQPTFLIEKISFLNVFFGFITGIIFGTFLVFVFKKVE